ncbi:hypothetical protein SAMN04487838_1173 [Streptococcus equinus]|uniref:hypothetical protein n=1 Tax=Streptococcus equinus TaxID=1335 RepID=UPI00040FE554|nr:hypothetical protein [Streptococcus equinus]SEK55261.1 hypothetical protein SAMN04487838_1173 [Streptococcus equinus]
MGLIERLKLQEKRRREGVKKGVSRFGNLLGLLIFYPLIFLLFYGTMNESELPMELNKCIFYLGIVVWITSLLLTIWDFLHNNQVLVGISSCLMYMYGFFVIPIISVISFNNGELNFIILQEISLILYPIILYVIATYVISDKDGNFRSTKFRKIISSLYLLPSLLLIIIGLIMSTIASDYYFIYLSWGIELLFSLFIDMIWYMAFYPLRHKDDEGADLAEASEVQSKAVNALNETLQEQHFDKERFK